jgi:Pregnancy-associated plasma protein-A
MSFSRILSRVAAAGLGATALTAVVLIAPAQARVADTGPACLTPTPNADIVAARGGTTGLDHRGISTAEQRAIMRRTDKRLAARGVSARSAALIARTVPVYVHVMRDAQGRGNVTDGQITQQIAVLNRAFVDLGFSFNLMDVSRHYNTAWHYDRQTANYRALTRRGGANALNIWLVDFRNLGVATFPWDAAKAVDGIRVNYESLPGGSIIHYNEGGTAAHETGHWLGLFHTFQGGCTTTNDQVSDTPAQSTPTTGCPPTRDSCPAHGTDPIHNYMDYSWDSCYWEFTAGQGERTSMMWAAYRA